MLRTGEDVASDVLHKFLLQGQLGLLVLLLPLLMLAWAPVFVAC